MQPKLEYTRSQNTHHIFVKGDKDKQIEPDEVYIHFPGGTIGVARVDNETYWAHIQLEDMKEDSTDVERKSKVVAARIDHKDKGVNETPFLFDEQMYHVAVKVKKI